MDLAKKLKEAESTIQGNFYTATKTYGKRTSEQVNIKVPYFDNFNFCYGRKATWDEQRQFNEDQNNSK